MARDDVKYVTEHLDVSLWDSAVEYVVLETVARYFNPAFGFAWPSLEKISFRAKVSPRRVNEITVALERRGLLVRLGPDPDCDLSKGAQRYVPVWRVEHGVQVALREAVDADARRLAESADAAAAQYEISQGGMRYTAGPPCGPSQGGGCDVPHPNSRYLDQEVRSEVQDRTETAAAAAQLRLPTILASVRRTLLEEIERKRRAHLAADPKDSNFKAVCRAVRDVRRDPEFGQRLLRHFDPARDEHVIEAARRLCDARHVDWGKPSSELLESALAWEKTRLQLLDEGEARPRERRRRRAR